MRSFDAHLRFTREPLTHSGLARVLATDPLVTLRVTALIHWQALRLWLKGAPYRRRGTPPTHPVTILDPVGGDALEVVA